jgi:hypothetical protein
MLDIIHTQKKSLKMTKAKLMELKAVVTNENINNSDKSVQEILDR